MHKWSVNGIRGALWFETSATDRCNIYGYPPSPSENVLRHKVSLLASINSPPGALPPRHYSKFVAAGYYTIEQRSKKYRIVFLNTNLWLNPVDSRMLHRVGSSTVDNTQDPFGQWSWFLSELGKAREKKETVGFPRIAKADVPRDIYIRYIIDLFFLFLSERAIIAVRPTHFSSPIIWRRNNPRHRHDIGTSDFYGLWSYEKLSRKGER